MKKLLQLLIVAILATALAFAFTACGRNGEGEGDEPDTPIATPTPAPTPTPEPVNEDDENGYENGDEVVRELFTSPPGYARVWRDFTAAGLNPGNINPHTMSGSTDFDANWLLRAHLIRRNQLSLGFEYVPEMAAELPIPCDDGLVWTIPIRQGMTWSTGTPINAYCFDYSFSMLLNPLLANRNPTGWWTDVQVVNARAYFLGENAPDEDLEVVTWEDVGFRVVDEYTIEFTFEIRPLGISVMQFFASQALVLVYRELYEAGMNEDRTATTYGTGDLQALPNFGPYRFGDVLHDQFTSYYRNDDFITAWMWGREVWSWRNIEMASTREAMFQDGHIDRLVVTAENYYTWREDPRTYRGRGGNPWNLYINTISTEVPALTNREFRRALYFGVDRELLAWAAFRVFAPAHSMIGTQAIVGDPLTGEVYAYRDTEFGINALPPNFGYDPDLALEYFDTAFSALGYEPIEFIIDYFEGQENMRRNAEILQEMWMDLFGADRLTVVLRSGPPPAIYDAMRDRTHQTGVGSMGQNNANIWTSMNVYTPYFAQPLTTFDDEEFTELFRRTTSGDLLHAPWEERAYALMRMEQIFFDYMPLIPLWQNTNWQVFSDRVHLLSPVFQPAGIGFVIETVDPMPWDGAVIIDMD